MVTYILEHKLCSRLEYTVINHNGNLGFTFGFPFSSNEAINFGMEAIHQLTHSAKNDTCLCLCTSERSMLLILLLLLGGDIELNPGNKHPRSICSKPAQPHQATNQSDVCDWWFHARCCKLPSNTSTFYLTHFVNGCVQYVVHRTQSHTLQILWFYQVL